MLFALHSACGDADNDAARLDAKLCAAVAERFAPLARPTGVPASPPCPDRRLVDGRPDPTCVDTGPDLALRSLVPAIRQIDTDSDDPTVLRVRALWHLATVGADDRAVGLFGAALNRDPSAKRHNDLAAALLLRAARADCPADLAAALDHAAHAAALDPGLTEASVNRAFALASLGFAVSEKSFSPSESVPSKVALGSVYEGRMRGQDLLGRWAEAYATGDQAAKDYLEAARTFAADRTDRVLAEAIALVEKTLVAQDRDRLTLLARGHAGFYRLAEPACDDLDALASADYHLAAAGTPFRAWTLLERAICAYFSLNYDTAGDLLSDLLTRWGTVEHSAIVARAEGLLGLIAMRQGRFAAADGHYRKAMESGAASGEEGSVVYFQAMAARNLAIAGQSEDSWRLRLQALRSRSAIRDPVRLYSIIEDTVQTLNHEGRSWAALAVSAEQIRAATDAARIDERNIDLVAFGWIDHAELLRGLGREAEASDALEVASNVTPFDHWNNDRVEHEIDTARALLGNADFAAIDHALGYFAGGGGLKDRVEFLRLLRRRVEVALARGDVETAETDLERGFFELERQRLTLVDSEQRARFLGSAQDLVAAAVRVALDYRGDPMAALNALERGSNRTLLDTTALNVAGDVPELSAATLAAMAPRGGLLVRWGHLDDKLLSWSIRSGETAVRFDAREVDAHALRRRIVSFRAAIYREAPKEEMHRYGEALAREVLPRAFDHLPPDTPLLLVPDDMLLGLPFPALRLEGEFLVERHPIRFAPSLALVARARPAHHGNPADTKEVLMVSDPAFAQERHPRLDRLRGVSAELADAVPDATILAGPAATRAAVLAALPNHRVAHIAAHGLVDPTFPSKGGILLADSPVGAAGDLLTGVDVSAGARGRLELVILAACSTGLGTDPGSADVAGLAASFLAQGVPGVVTAAWPIDDAAAARFFAEVHRALGAWMAPEQALRQAALAELGQAEGGTVRHWAGFQLWVSGNGASASVYDSERDGARQSNSN